MQIIFLKNTLVETTTYHAGAVVDLEVTGDLKKVLVARGQADWFTPPVEKVEPVEKAKKVKV